jgi:hypothetical protein
VVLTPPRAVKTRIDGRVAAIDLITDREKLRGLAA